MTWLAPIQSIKNKRQQENRSYYLVHHIQILNRKKNYPVCPECDAKRYVRVKSQEEWKCVRCNIFWPNVT